jgi:hypothetical protein
VLAPTPTGRLALVRLLLRQRRVPLALTLTLLARHCRLDRFTGPARLLEIAIPWRLLGVGHLGLL